MMTRKCECGKNAVFYGVSYTDATEYHQFWCADCDEKIEVDIKTIFAEANPPQEKPEGPTQKDVDAAWEKALKLKEEQLAAARREGAEWMKQLIYKHVSD